MKEKGFTLIELLAVIVILSVITLITVPMITNVIEESQKKALVSSVQGILDSTDYFTMSHETGVYEFLFDEEHQGSTKKGESLDYRGTIDGEGKLYLDKEGNVSICISNDKYYVYKNYNSGIIVGERSKDNCDIEYDALTNKYVAFLESEGTGSNVYSKDEVDNLVDNLDTKITNMKSNIEELQNNLNNYALQSELDKTNTNVENLSSISSMNTSKIDNLTNQFNSPKSLKYIYVANTPSDTEGIKNALLNYYKGMPFPSMDTVLVGDNKGGSFIGGGVYAITMYKISDLYGSMIGYQYTSTGVSKLYISVVEGKLGQYVIN